MDLHPIAVHFPIGLLTFYSIMELVSFGRLGRSSAVFHIKLFLVAVGAFMGVFTIGTGLWAERKFLGTDMMVLVGTHKAFAITTIVLYWVLAAAYLARFAETYGKNVWGWLRATSSLVLHPVVSKLLALITLGTMMIVGALGGAIVYGPDIDPAVRLIYNLVIGPQL